MNKNGKPFGYHKPKVTPPSPPKVKDPVDRNQEHLVACSIYRGCEYHSFGFRSHAQIRSRLGDKDAYDQKHRPDDIEGFETSEGRFVNRREAKLIAEECGQCQPMRRELLSSDITW